MIGLDRLSLNQATVKRLSLPDAAALCGEAGIPAIGVWRDRVAEVGVREAAAMIRAAGLHVSSLCRAGFFTAIGASRAENLDAIEEAAALEADVLVLVCGGLPPDSRDLDLARRQVVDGIGDLVPRAQELGVRLGVEALHPMFCADRSVVATIGEALEIAEGFPVDAVGIVIDTYHVWWDPQRAATIARAGERIASFQVCDWVVPLPEDMLLGRGHVGDGHIDFAPIAAAVEAAGYTGYVEVEIFNQRIWDDDAQRTVHIVRERFGRLAT